MRDRVRRVHFVGIGGAGMCGIAEVLHNLQFEVSGSDVRESPNTRRLTSLGVKVAIGHDPQLVKAVDVVVVSSAVDETNSEVRAARAARIPVIPRAEMLGELMRLQRGIAIAGTHGKTTTTSLIASCLAEGGVDPTFVIGGRLNSAGTHARLGRGQYLVAEADESDASFLHLSPFMAVVTNIDADHMATYGGDFNRLKQAFVDFLQQLPFYGLAVLCIDDPVVREIIPRVHRPVLTYGTAPEADLRAVSIRQQETRMHFTVELRGQKNWLTVELNQPGHHNVLNALAAIGIAHELGVKEAAITRALAGFGGIGRRFQINGIIPWGGDVQGRTSVAGDRTSGATDVILVDDYAHHPREIAATVAAARASWPQRRLVVVFQPHRYTRTHDLLDDFSTVLAGLDMLIVTEVYAAGEKPVSGADGRALCRAIRARGKVDPIFIEDVSTLPQVLTDVLHGNDVLLTLGAGSIGSIAASLPQALGKRGKE
ncbi:MAG: UDP-N-acetylmuramate--L-alanine ligase [Candidatus Muproteobacteria bacterium RIFCSPHIGHO2_12_FULL_60_33]|uniref:UDP-N-acetylmuramate--L-alanine ligase n=1 Tax=Candidatus Muproteobacteria bacterium RIFCSPLOWO2_01_FULL_60_18 TaxID=1817768 RepID=A0A1F6TXQ3_9PROT|nr:MAG: UDP-N-acetylmuramate--L-alanine ligase [Candidatus Muproteobacteria bacterium RIFCSPLOWO2_01_FULL_60_18]OGI50581.1 MAG: UDP-N-acetylmuramate--L-alanine ligase [Candidatus Muproteobacteria bacterium RIFCSPHIGHO2_01_60_12]OGI56312.1 MAG: UDP-N-acetylmuramate--L-alanine ligase [Candidatus Muproteobacteria bacterium RIFCSPHIGHO2_12_FULL_60_33]OGI56484.1 MAG: UDP-N-acetylmuramate--L-alanine ligase [Candidatus Muproteobacteria bacterium RIFCSPHIGHO2_02_FULL_60_13]OGI58512.1 MAG: UDP-N-acetylm